MNSINLRLNHRGREVWNAPQSPGRKCRTALSRMRYSATTSMTEPRENEHDNTP